MRKVLKAPKGMAYTNGKDTHGYVISLEVGLDGKDFYLITEEEYQKLIDDHEEN